MDGRKALAPGTVLRLRTRTGFAEYTVRGEAGRGASCIVYDAFYTDNPGNAKLVRIKECCPRALRIVRLENGSLRPAGCDRDAFEAARARMADAYQRNHTLFISEELTNSVSCASDLYEANGTVYIVYSWLNGKTFAENPGSSLRECVSLVLSAARVLRGIHDAGFLYLDLKPENILTLRGSLDLIQLFDFDSMVSVKELADAVRGGRPDALRLSFSRGFAPPEQQTGKLRLIGKHSDLYSLGAVLFHALWRRTPSAFDCDGDAEYDFSSAAYASGDYQDALYRELTLFFRKTLASYHGDRYQDAAEAVEQLRLIVSLADGTKRWLRSTPVPGNPVFYGREKELSGLDALLAGAERGVVSLYGLGGIGKSALAREYVRRCGKSWDAVLWLYDQGNPEVMIADDSLVSLHAVRRMKEESAEEYLRRKLEALTSFTDGRRILLVLDGFSPARPDRLKRLETVGWTILLISRERLPDGLYPSMRVDELEERDLALLFERYSGLVPEDADGLGSLRSILSAVHGHTLLTELIARQAAKSRLDLRTAEALVAGSGLSRLPGEKIDYIRDQSAFHSTLMRILDRLVGADRFTEEDRLCLKLLSVFDVPGIEAGLFRSLSGLRSLDSLNGLEAAGWLKSEGRMLYLHPVMLEYIRAWPWEESAAQAAERMMRNLYGRIRPAGTRHDGSRQFPEDYDSLRALLRTADQLISRAARVSEASQRLLFRTLIDAPVDEDVRVLSRTLELLKNPAYLDDGSILRLYENAAYLQARTGTPEEAVRILAGMRRYLSRHPGAYYLSAYHRAMAVVLHNAGRPEYRKRILRHEDMAVAAARVASHPDAKKQLAACLLSKAVTLLSEDTDRKQAGRLIREAEPLVKRYASRTDYESYQYFCTAAMYSAMNGDPPEAERLLAAADGIAFSASDSDLSDAEHLIEQDAPIRLAMGQYEKAAEAVLRAVSLCGRHPESVRYRGTRFDAYLFLGRIYAMNREYVKSEEAFAAAEKYAADAPYECEPPFCPEEVRSGAEAERNRRS